MNILEGTICPTAGLVLPNHHGLPEKWLPANCPNVTHLFNSLSSPLPILSFLHLATGPQGDYFFLKAALSLGFYTRLFLNPRPPPYHRLFPVSCVPCLVMSMREEDTSSVASGKLLILCGPVLSLTGAVVIEREPIFPRICCENEVYI